MIMATTESPAARCPIFTDMTLAERAEVLKLLEDEHYPAGEVILKEGNAVQILWIIVTGRCEVVKTMKNGTQQQLVELEPGSVFGEMSFFKPAPHSASVRTLTEVQVLRLPREQFDHLHTVCPSAACHIAASTVAVLAERLRKMDKWTCDLVEKPGADGHKEEWREFRSKLYSGWKF